jgi:hypothetical protein
VPFNNHNHYRAEGVKFAFAREQLEGVAPDTIDTNMGLIKGGVVLPDPEYAWDYFWGIGRSGRGRLTAHEGPQTFHGSVPVILAQFNESRDIMEMILGSLSGDSLEAKAANATIIYAATTITDTAEDFTTPDRKDGTHAIYAGVSVGFIGTDVGGGVTEMTVYPTPDRVSPAGWNGPIPVSLGSGDGYEIRLTTGSGESKSSADVGVAAGDKFIIPISRLQTMTWGAQFRGAGGQADVVMNYLGGKVNRATLSARQGEKLQIALEDVVFRDLRHDVALPSSSVAKFAAIGTGSGATKRPTGTQSTEEPLVFSQGAVNLFEVTNTFAKVVAFSISIDHQLTEQQYVSNITVDGSTTQISQVVNEITEGLRAITVEIEAYLDNREFWEHLMRQGLDDSLTLNAKTGFDLRLVFTNNVSGETVEFQMPAASDPVLVVPVTGAANLASSSNVGAVIESAPHSIPGETESLIPIRFRVNVPNLVVRYTDG